MTKTLGDELPREIQRVNELIAQYDSIGTPGAWAAATMRAVVLDALYASASGDITAMIRAYQELKGFE